MEIKILGTGCPKCRTLEDMTRKAAEKAGVEATITKEEDIMKIMEHGVMRTPGLVIDGNVVFSGRLPSADELLEAINKNR